MREVWFVANKNNVSLDFGLYAFFKAYKFSFTEHFIFIFYFVNINFLNSVIAK